MARKSKSLMSWYKNRARDALSALKKKTTDTVFRSLGYDYITATVSKVAQYKQADELQEAYGKLYKLIEDTPDQNRSYWRTVSFDDVFRVGATGVKSRQTSVDLLFGNEPDRMALDQYR